MKSVEAYLARIGCEGVRGATAENLFALQKAHLYRVPYETLDILSASPGGLTADELYEKIVVRKRGGYCFELNGALAWLLRELGYELTEYFARWHFGMNDAVPPRRHRVLGVRVGGRSYLVDAGVASPCPHTPLELVENTVQTRNGLEFRVVRDARFGFVVERSTEQGFAAFYSFWPFPNEERDFDYVHYHCSHSPDSVFRQRLFVNIATDCGRDNISDEIQPDGTRKRMFRAGLPDGGVRERELRSDAELAAVLKDSFGIVR